MVTQDNNEIMIAHRRNLHKIPETGTHLPLTRDYIISVLKRIGIPYVTNKTDSGVMAYIEVPESRQTIAFRADMDALPITEETGLYFSSTNGCMHACGHDAHMSILLFTIEKLWEHRKMLSVSVLFLFQTGEECAKGAKNIKTEPFYIKHKPDTVYGLHIGRIHPDVANGRLGISPGKLMASYDKFAITLRGRGVHASTPELGINPIQAAASIISSLNSIIPNELPAKEPATLTTAHINSGSIYNVIPDTCTIEGTFRTLNEETRLFIGNRIKEISDYISRSFRCTANTDIIWGAASVINDSKETEYVLSLASEIFRNEELVTDLSPVMVGEDFSEYLADIPGCFFLLGSSKSDGERVYPHHNSRFDIDESVMWKGAALFCKIACSKT